VRHIFIGGTARFGTCSRWNSKKNQWFFPTVNSDVLVNAVKIIKLFTDSFHYIFILVRSVQRFCSVKMYFPEFRDGGVGVEPLEPPSCTRLFRSNPKFFYGPFPPPHTCHCRVTIVRTNVLANEWRRTKRRVRGRPRVRDDGERVNESWREGVSA
jgi:hypothetical protein